MSDPSRDERLKDLSARIEKAKAGTEVKHHSEEHYSQANMAWRMVIELVSGLGLGFAIGYGLDILFGTLPIFMVVFIGLGFAAGVKVMMRTAGELQIRSEAGPPARKED